ncbi:hypothetical protein J6253_05150 [bacterium]|jgi:hypothetical protein|nr:hypothetical protein [bacterium]MBP5592518.1 hypothetical protein [bacterium]
MSFSKFVLLFVSLIFASVLYADDGSSLKDEAQAKADKISDVEAELNKASAEASAAKDQKWKSCVNGHLGTVKGLAASAASIAAKIPGLVAAGKTAEAQSQLVILSGMADSADKSLAEAQNCERSAAPQQQAKTEQDSASKGGVTSAMNLDLGNDMPAEINRGSVEGSDSADAANVDSSDVPQTANDGSADTTVVVSETPEDASQIEQVPDQEDQSPTM